MIRPLFNPPSPHSLPLPPLPLQPPRFLPLIHCPHRPLRLLLALLEIRSSQRNHLIYILGRVDEIPRRHKGRGVGIYALHFGVGKEGEIDECDASVGGEEGPVGGGGEGFAWGGFGGGFALKGCADPDVAVA